MYYDLFQQVRQGGSFAKEQIEDNQLKYCWGQVRVVEDKEYLPHPTHYFVVQNGLLYCVANKQIDGRRKTSTSGPTNQDRAGYGTGSLTPTGGRPGGRQHPSATPGPFPLANNGCRNPAALSMLPVCQCTALQRSDELLHPVL